MTRFTRPNLLAATALGLLLAGTLAACSGGASSASTAASPAPTAEASSTVSSEPATGAGAVAAKVSANTASQQEIVTALTNAGVANPERWAREIEEYRPYDAGDTNLQKLQDKLKKYNPDAATLAGILSVLQP